MTVTGSIAGCGSRASSGAGRWRPRRWPAAGFTCRLRALAPGDRLDITLGPDLWTVIVRKLPSRRGPATEAKDCFEETPDSELRRSVARDRRRTDRSLIVAPPGRPDKRDRRALRRLHGRTDT